MKSSFKVYYDYYISTARESADKLDGQTMQVRRDQSLPCERGGGGAEFKVAGVVSGIQPY